MFDYFVSRNFIPTTYFGFVRKEDTVKVNWEDFRKHSSNAGCFGGTYFSSLAKASADVKENIENKYVIGGSSPKLLDPRFFLNPTLYFHFNALPNWGTRLIDEINGTFSNIKINIVHSKVIPAKIVPYEYKSYGFTDECQCSTCVKAREIEKKKNGGKMITVCSNDDCEFELISPIMCIEFPEEYTDLYSKVWLQYLLMTLIREISISERYLNLDEILNPKQTGIDLILSINKKNLNQYRSLCNFKLSRELILAIDSVYVAKKLNDCIISKIVSVLPALMSSRQTSEFRLIEKILKEKTE